MKPTDDPLTKLPPELVLRVLEFCPTPTIACLTRLSRAWNTFIEVEHQEAIYSVDNKILIPPGCKGFSEIASTATSFARFFDGTHSSKDLCKRQTLLRRNWESTRPYTTQSVIQLRPGYAASPWRIRADFKRRFFVSTSMGGGLRVTCMDTGHQLWVLPSTEDHTPGHAVRPYAHLEYKDGLAVFDREGDALEVWQTDLEGLHHGKFKQTAVIPFECQTRGFQLSGGTLCVVSTEGYGFVYDMAQQPPQRIRRLDVSREATGHLYQNEDVVMYSMGEEAYHIYDKASGDFLGVLAPQPDVMRFHIDRPVSKYERTPGQHGPTDRAFPPSMPRDDRLTPIEILAGPLEEASPVDVDEWGAGALCGNLMVGLSRRGHVFICPDWREALKGRHEHSAVVECEYGGTDFDLGGWLSVKDHRIVVEVQDKLYIIALDDDDRVQVSINTNDHSRRQRPSYALATSSSPRLAEPVSFVSLFDDCIVSTYRTLSLRRGPDVQLGERAPQDDGLAQIHSRRMIRIVSLAPELERKPPALWEPPTGASSTPSQLSRRELLRLMIGSINIDDDMPRPQDAVMVELTADFLGVEPLVD